MAYIVCVWSMVAFTLPCFVHKTLFIRFLNEAVSQVVRYTQICVCTEITQKGVIFDVSFV